MKRNVRPLQAYHITLKSINIKKKKGKLTIELTALQLFAIASRRNRLPLRRKPWKNPNN